MVKGGASQEEIDYVRRTQGSMDPRDVVRHRYFINEYNPGDPWRQPNNFVLHPQNYTYGPGRESPQYIGQMLSTLPIGSVNVQGPQFNLPSQIKPYVYFNGQPFYG